MSYVHSPFLYLAMSITLVGCQDPISPQPQPKVAPVEFAQADHDVKVASAEMDDYTYAQRAAFASKMQLQLDHLNADLDALSHKVEQAQGPAKDEAAVKLASLRAQSAAMQQHLQKVSSSDESGWNDIKSGIKKSYSDFKDSIKDTRQWVSDKIAP